MSSAVPNSTTTAINDNNHDSKEPHCISLQNVKEAASRINGIAVRTPLLTASYFHENGKKLFFKTEALQKTGSFKFRGAVNATKCELAGTTDSNNNDSTTVGKSMTTIVTHSSGNHAQAVALAAKETSTEDRPVESVIVMPRNAPAIKQAGVKRFGGKIVLVDNTNEAREEAAEEIMVQTGASFIHPSEDPRVIAGQGTASLELVEQLREDYGCDKPDAVIIPVGGGGLAAGNTIALRGMLGDNVKIILAEPAELDDAKRSFDAGELLKHAPDNQLNSVADGLKTTLGPNTWPIVRDLVDDIFTVSEKEILRQTKEVWEQLKICIEPSAGVGVAVARSEEFNAKYKTKDGIRNVAVILCGGNVDILKTTEKMKELGL